MITIQQAFVLGAHRAVREPSALSCGEALISFMRHLRDAEEPLEVIVLFLAEISTREEIVGGCSTVNYVSTNDDDLRPLRDALWYGACYARHPRFQSFVGNEDRYRVLTSFCERQRREIQGEADFFANMDDADLSKLWRRAMLFAARVHDPRDIERAMHLSDAAFERSIEMTIDDADRALPFSELLDCVEASAFA